MPSITAKPTVNQASRTFRELHEVFNLDTADPKVDLLAANLAAQIAAQPHPVCLGLFQKERLRRIYGLTHLLSGYGVTLRAKRRELDGMVFVYGEIELPVAVQFVGTLAYGVPVMQGAAA